MRALVNQLRPHQLAYQLVLIGVLSGGAVPLRTAGAVGLACLAVAIAMIGGDLAHREADLQTGRARLSARHPQALIAVAVLGLVVLASATVLVGGVRCLVALAVVQAATALYSLAKKRHLLLLSALGRALAGAGVVWVYGLWFGLSEGLGPLSAILGVLDVVVNLAGDIRDAALDRRAGLRTLPLLIGDHGTLAVIFGGMALAIGCGLPRGGGLLGWGLVAAAVAGVAWAPTRWKHGAAHGPKVAIAAMSAAAWTGNVLSPAALGGALVLWLSCYALYVWSLP